MVAAQNVYWLIFGEIIRTLPSPNATSIPVGFEVAGKRRSQALPGPNGPTWNGAAGGGSLAAPAIEPKCTLIGSLVHLFGNFSGIAISVETNPAGFAGVANAYAGVDGPNVPYAHKL